MKRIYTSIGNQCNYRCQKQLQHLYIPKTTQIYSFIPLSYSLDLWHKSPIKEETKSGRQILNKISLLSFCLHVTKWDLFAVGRFTFQIKQDSHFDVYSVGLENKQLEW